MVPALAGCATSVVMTGGDGSTSTVNMFEVLLTRPAESTVMAVSVCTPSAKIAEVAKAK